MPEVSLPVIPWANRPDTNNSSGPQAVRRQDNTTTELRVPYGIRRTVRTLPAVISCVSIVRACYAFAPSVVRDLLYEINESTANAACLTVPAVAVGSIANILSGVSSSFTHAFLTSAGLGVSFGALFTLRALMHFNSYGQNYCHKDADGWPIVCYGEDHFTHLVVAHGIFASATFPALILTLKKVKVDPTVKTIKHRN